MTSDTTETEELSPELDEFFAAYVIAALWSTGESEEDGTEIGPLEDNYDIDDLSDDCRKQMLDDCRSFLDSNREAIGDQWAQAGHDFWLTRNGHGSGFWDRADDMYPGDKHELSKAAKVYGSVDLYSHDGKVWCS